MCAKPLVIGEMLQNATGSVEPNKRRNPLFASITLGEPQIEGLGQLDRLFGEVLLQSGQILYKWQFLTKIDGVEWRGAVRHDFAENALQVICLNVE